MPRRRKIGAFYAQHPFCKWMLLMSRQPHAFQNLQVMFDFSQATAYRWAAGDCLPSGKHMAVYDYFKEQAKKRAKADV